MDMQSDSHYGSGGMHGIIPRDEYAAQCQEQIERKYSMDGIIGIVDSLNKLEEEGYEAMKNKQKIVDPDIIIEAFVHFFDAHYPYAPVSRRNRVR